MLFKSEDPGVSFDTVALNMYKSTKPTGKTKPVSFPLVAKPSKPPSSHISELLLETAITRVAQGSSAKHQLTAAEAQLSLRAA